MPTQTCKELWPTFQIIILSSGRGAFHVLYLICFLFFVSWGNILAFWGTHSGLALDCYKIKAHIVQKNLGMASDDYLFLADSLGPQIYLLRRGSIQQRKAEVYDSKASNTSSFRKMGNDTSVSGGVCVIGAGQEHKRFDWSRSKTQAYTDSKRRIGFKDVFSHYDRSEEQMKDNKRWSLQKYMEKWLELQQDPERMELADNDGLAIACPNGEISHTLKTVQEPPTRTTRLKSTGSTPPICTTVRPPFVMLCLADF